MPPVPAENHCYIRSMAAGTLCAEKLKLDRSTLPVTPESRYRPQKIRLLLPRKPAMGLMRSTR